MSLTGSVAPSHCLALQKEPKKRRGRGKWKEGEEEMTALGQERQYDKGKSQRDSAKELQRSVGGGVQDGQFEL